MVYLYIYQVALKLVKRFIYTVIIKNCLMKHLSSHLCTHILIAEIPNALGCSSNYENPKHKEHAHHKSESNINSEYDALDKH